jgi:DNA-binding MarR family transcriptional regulator
MHISGRAARQANLFGAVALGVLDRLCSAVAGDGGSLSASAALIHLRLRPGKTIDFLARVLAISHPATVRLVDRLEDGGLVERHGGRDGRSRALVLTRAGQKAASGLLADRLAVMEDLLAPLSATERRQLEALLEKLLAAMPGDRWAARHLCRLCDFPTCASPTCPVDTSVDEPGLAIGAVAPVR